MIGFVIGCAAGFIVGRIYQWTGDAQRMMGSRDRKRR